MTGLAELPQALMALLPEYGYVLLGLATLVGAAGLPLPLTPLLLAAGALTTEGDLSFAAAAATVLLAAVAGDCAGYGVGRLAGRPLLVRAGPRLGLSAARLAGAERTFQRWGGGTVWLSRWLLTPASLAVNLLAGANGYRFALFLTFDVLGEMVWTGGYLTLGRLFGESWTELLDLLGSLGGLVVAVGAAGVLGFLAWRLLRSHRDTAGDAQQRAILNVLPPPT